MKEIRKIWIGKTIKEDSMSWHVGQRVRLGRKEGDQGVIDHIKISEDGKGYEVHVKKANLVFPWKYTTMDVTLEYDILF